MCDISQEITFHFTIQQEHVIDLFMEIYWKWNGSVGNGTTSSFLYITSCLSVCLDWSGSCDKRSAFHFFFVHLILLWLSSYAFSVEIQIKIIWQDLHTPRKRFHPRQSVILWYYFLTWFISSDSYNFSSCQHYSLFFWADLSTLRQK